jgi:hypothetical protein
MCGADLQVCAGTPGPAVHSTAFAAAIVNFRLKYPLSTYTRSGTLQITLTRLLSTTSVAGPEFNPISSILAPANMSRPMGASHGGAVPIATESNQMVGSSGSTGSRIWSLATRPL